jgi:hypothetical protein
MVLMVFEPQGYLFERDDDDLARYVDVPLARSSLLLRI